MKRRTAFRAFGVLVLSFAPSLFAKPMFINYSVYLTDKTGTPRTDIVDKGVYFRLYDANQAGSLLWSETIITSAPKGFLQVKLGKGTPINPAAIAAAPALWLEMQIGSEPVFPRQEIATSFYAVAANHADTASFSVVSGNALQFGGKAPDSYALTSQIPGKPTRVDSSAFSDTAFFATTALQLKVVPTRIDTASVADKAVTLLAGASTLGDLAINGQVAANTYAYRLPKTVRYYFSSDQIIRPDWTIAAWSTSGSHSAFASYPNVAVNWKQVALIPFAPKSGSKLKKIMVRVTDASTGLPDIGVSLAYRDFDSNSTEYGALLLCSKFYQQSSAYQYGVETTGLNSASVFHDLEISKDFTLNSTSLQYYCGVSFTENTTPGTNWFEFAIFEVEEYEP